MLKHISKRKFGSFVKMTMLGLALLTPFSITATAENYKVSLNKTQILHLPAPAAAIVIGNPDIADITIHSSDTLFIIGRGYGETNILALDSNGQTILSANIIVTTDRSPNSVRIVNIGQGQETYHCAPNCLPSPILGDHLQFIEMYSSHAEPIRSTSGTGSSSLAQTANVATNPAYTSTPPNAQFSGAPSSRPIFASPNSRPAPGVED